MANRQMSIEDHVTCSICMDLYVDPVALPCMHSFCRKCLVGIVASAMVLNCPECRKNIKLGNRGVGGLAKNFQLANIVESYKHEHEDQESPQTTDPEASPQLPLCTQHRVTCQLLCTTCKTSVCYRCVVEKHGGHKYELSDNRTVQNQSSGEGGICRQHSQHYRLYCKQCNVVVCLSCIVKKHQGHFFTTFEDLHPSAMKTVSSSIEELDARRRLLRATNKTCRTLAQKVQKDTQNKRQEMTCYFSRLRDAIDRREAALRAELDAREEESVGGYLHRAEHAQRKEAHVTGVVDDIKRLLTEDKVHVLQTYKERTSRVADLIKDESDDRPPFTKGVDGGTLQTCAIDRELANIKWAWPKEELKPVRKAPPVPTDNQSNPVPEMTSQRRHTLKIRCSVQRGKDWTHGQTDGGPGHFGVVTQPNIEPDVYTVRWPNGKTGNYKYAPPYEEQIMPIS